MADPRVLPMSVTDAPPIPRPFRMTYNCHLSRCITSATLYCPSSRTIRCLLWLLSRGAAGEVGIKGRDTQFISVVTRELSVITVEPERDDIRYRQLMAELENFAAAFAISSDICLSPEANKRWNFYKCVDFPSRKWWIDRPHNCIFRVIYHQSEPWNRPSI